jgi:multidrug efflux pump subunit AcrA (membrane-fusion protein)
MSTTNDQVSEPPQMQGADALYHAPGPKHGHSFRHWLIFVVGFLVVAALVVFFGWLPRRRQSEEVARETQQRTHEIPKVQVMKVQRAKTASGLQIPGTTLAYTEAYIYARASGYVSKRLVDIGDHVRQGQLLATIDAPDLDQQVSQAKSALAQSESNVAQLQAQVHLQALNWDRYKVLVAKGVFSRQQGDQQEADFRVAEANVQAAQSAVQGNRENLQRLIVLQQYEQVTAPFSGIVTARNVDVGTLINAGGSGLGASSASSPNTTQAGAQGNNAGVSGSLTSNVAPATGGSQGGEMFGIASVNPVRILVSIPEGYASLVHVGDRADLLIGETSQSKYEGRVTRTSASIDTNTRTLLVDLQAPNPLGRIMPGMYVVVNFDQFKSQPPLLVPGEAIIVRDGESKLAVMSTDNTVHFKPIQIGRDFGTQTEIASGLTVGDVVVTIITDEVRDGGKVEPVFPQQPKAPAGGQNDRKPAVDGQYGNQNLSNDGGKASKQNQGSGHSDQGKSGKSSGSAQ